ncbi:hypothetical protein IIJ84_003802 [Salmonella enterica subsp. enterica serovar Oranienburg]|nr:hypothetical protein [Salmonella enterica subsp. enterica serovar Oranienburg]ECA1474098.1 hypothetical protein [Salmonella enterica subsp. enterica serovar Oranienburg]ECA9000196.1 hypothetical protein [Salmonella enterica subsp. enterica serovar Oranienburg]ECA9347053.1 hypothetical protein [Salmonella enterica subsp. enterica serovar Oranienburg]ECD3079260.1 hypothetical protein [Salmonella enterica subsp. enterica serovar Oranienburg]
MKINTFYKGCTLKIWRKTRDLIFRPGAHRFDHIGVFNDSFKIPGAVTWNVVIAALRTVVKAVIIAVNRKIFGIFFTNRALPIG